ncbi:hypothetical protein [Pedobacter frigiditerrae]|uniref:hypothetical protein n=1 Tax=Pedobacter frigiditerrae TaxID=2530452 RepID=UPI002930AB7A|nr:hypothetical protein [Pedobacter frigiditerrae]
MKSFLPFPIKGFKGKKIGMDSQANFDLALKLLFKTIKNPKEITHVFWFSSPLEKQA